MATLNAIQNEEYPADRLAMGIRLGITVGIVFGQALLITAETAFFPNSAARFNVNFIIYGQIEDGQAVPIDENRFRAFPKLKRHVVDVCETLRSPVFCIGNYAGNGISARANIEESLDFFARFNKLYGHLIKARFSKKPRVNFILYGSDDFEARAKIMDRDSDAIHNYYAKAIWEKFPPGFLPVE